MDSLSFLTDLDSPSTGVHFNRQWILQQIMALCYALDDLNSSFTFVLCPGYGGTDGNKEGDGATRHVAESSQVDAIVVRCDKGKVQSE